MATKLGMLILQRRSTTVRVSVASMENDSPDVATAKRLLDQAKLRGFTFQRISAGEDGPLVGHRVSESWIDLIHLEGFSHDCFAWRKRKSLLILPGNSPIERQVNGHAIDVLNEVLTW